MGMSFKARKRLALLVLLVGLPLYIIIAVTVVGWFSPMPPLLEVGIYLALGLIWAFPLKWVFLGIGQTNPEDRDPKP